MEIQVQDIKYNYGKFKVKTNQIYPRLDIDKALNNRYTKEETYNKDELNSLITTPDVQYVSVTATEQTTDVTDVLPITGAADTIYRVGNWDGSQFDASAYSEYAWSDSLYVYLDTKTQIGEVFDISAYYATGGVLAKYTNLAAALDSNNGGGVPLSLQKGGMSVKFVQIPDNKYVQYFCKAQTFTTDVTAWEKINLEEKANELFGTETISLGKERETACYWKAQDGKVVLETQSTSIYAFHPINIVENIYYKVTTNLYGLSVAPYYITDEEDNILRTGSGNSLQTLDGFAPAGSAKIYINNAITATTASIPSLGLGDNVFKLISDVKAMIKPEQIKSLTEIVNDFSYLVYKNVGDIDYIQGQKKFIKVTQQSPLQYEEVTPADNSLWIYNDHLYHWNGTDLVPSMTEQVIKLYKIATSAPRGISKGEYYYNSNIKKLYRNNGNTYNSTEIPLRTDTVFIYDNSLYLWNGTDLVKKDLTLDEIISGVTPTINTTVNATINEYKEEYGAREIVVNTQSLALTENDFVSGNLEGLTGKEVVETICIRSGYIQAVPGSSITLHTENGYRHTIFEFKADKSYRLNDTFSTTDKTVILRTDTEFVRFVIASPSGVQTAPVWEDAGFTATPNKIYEYGRAAIEHKKSLKEIVSNISLLVYKNVGDIDYITGTSKFITIKKSSPLQYEEIIPLVDDIWECNDHLYHWNGTELVSCMTEQVIKLYAITTSAPSGINKGDYYFNTNSKKLFRNNGSQYNSTEVPLRTDVVFIYKGGFYIWNGTDLVSKEEIIELPILAPSPQLPANAETDSDFNIETVTSVELHTAFASLIDKQIAYGSGTKHSSKNLNRYEVSGLDASGVYPIYTYVYGRRNRFAYRYADELYAWKDGNDNIVYVDSTCPRTGDTIYSDINRTDSGKTVLTYNSATGIMTDSSSDTYTRDEESNIEADMFWTTAYILKNNPTSQTALSKDGQSLGTASYVDSTHLALNGKTYTRSECFDYHTDQKSTIFIWTNEHGPSSDPLEPSVVLYRFIKDLCGGCRNNQFIEFLKMYCKIVFIPCANPWGCQYPRVYGRVNSNGVNINRNYDTPGWSVQSDSDKGSVVGSESETQYIMNMCRRFTPDISIDIHCLGYVELINEGLMYLSETYIPDNSFYNRTVGIMNSFGFLFDKRGNPTPDAGAHGSEWLDWLGYIGGVFEMNCGDYSTTYNGKQHTSVIMDACYTEFLNCIRMWYAQYDPKLDLSKLRIK